MPKTLIDCGFHKGWITKKFFKDNPSGIVHAFEPNPRFQRHADWFSERFLGQFNFYNSAVLTVDSCCFLNLGKGDQQGSSIYKGKGYLSGESVEVRTINLPKFVQNLPRDTYICLKLDVEGAEYPILDAMIRDNSIKRIKELTVEFHAKKFNDGRFKEKDAKIKDWLDKNKIFEKLVIYG